MKKSFLLIAATAILGLAACTPSKGGKGGGGGGKTPDIPTEEGKFTVYFTPGAESAELPDYAGYFFAGKLTGWAEETAPELVNLEGTDYYYAIVEAPEDYDWDAADALDYKITLGYNAESGAPKIGVSWSYESDVDKQYEFGTNPQLEKNGQFLNCGTHSWDAVPGPVITVTNVTVSVTLSAPAPEYLTFAMPGDFNGWNNEAVMTPNDDRTVFSYTIASTIVAGKHEGQMLMYYTGTPTWDNKLLGDKSSNYEFSFSKLHEQNGYNFNEEDMELEGEPLVVKFLQDPDALVEINLQIKIIADAPITNALKGGTAVAGTWDDTMIANEANTEFTFSYSKTDENPHKGPTQYQFQLYANGWHQKLDVKVATLAKDTLVTITLKDGGAAYFNTDKESWDAISDDLYTVESSELAA